jgi:anthranilate phosphoribosyltransferase
VVVFNAAAAILVSDLGILDLPLSVELAASVIDSGKALALRDKYIQATQSV